MAGASQSINLEIENAAEVKAAFQELAARLNDLTPVFRDIGEAMLNSTRARFSPENQKGPDNKKWAELNEDYKARKPKNKDKILTLYGDLARLLNYQPAPMEVRIGTPLEYGAAHQFGRPEINLPARPFLGVSDDDAAEILAILNEYLAGAL